MENMMFDLEMIDEILSVDRQVWYVAIIDSVGNVITSKLKKNTNNTIENEEEMYMIDLRIMRFMMNAFDNSFGKTISLQTKREKTCQMMYYRDNLIVYITCDPKMDSKKILEISNKIEPLVHAMIS